jgi:hypothetical protein
MTYDVAALVRRCRDGGTVADSDVIDMRRAFFGGDQQITEDEAAALFDVNDALEAPSPAWTEFFIEAITEYIVRQAVPEDYVDDRNAVWLMEHVARDGRIKSATELELLVKVVETARAAPRELSQFVLDEVKHAVITGEGPIRNGALDPGRITMAEVAMVRRVLFGLGSAAGMAISRGEAEALFEIDEAVADQDDVPEWGQIFAKAVGDHLMAAVLHRAPPREEARRRELWLDEPTQGVSGIFGRMFGSFGGAIKDTTALFRNGDETETAERAAAREAAIRDAAVITGDEAAWVFQRIGQNGRVTPAEQRLIEFMSEEADNLPPGYDQMVERLRKVA